MDIQPRDPRLNPKLAGAVEKARGAWDLREQLAYRKSILLSFDEMLDSLLDTCLTYTDIGIACGVSRERIRQIHRDYFAEVLPYRDHGRIRACRIATRHKRRQELQPTGPAAEFAAAARLHGCDVRPVLGSEIKITGAGHRLVVNGASVHVSINKRPPRRGRKEITASFHFRLPSQPVDYVVAKCLDAWFIFPAHFFAERKWGGSYNIPERVTDYLGHTRSAEIWSYREAWSLFTNK